MSRKINAHRAEVLQQSHAAEGRRNHMKKRTKEEMAEYQRNRRKAAVTPEPIIDMQHVVPGACPNCERLVADLDQYKKESAAEIALLQARIVTLEVQARRKPEPLPQGDDADALRKRVIADKVNRINSFGKNPCIGKAAM